MLNFERCIKNIPAKCPYYYRGNEWKTFVRVLILSMLIIGSALSTIAFFTASASSFTTTHDPNTQSDGTTTDKQTIQQHDLRKGRYWDTTSTINENHPFVQFKKLNDGNDYLNTIKNDKVSNPTLGMQNFTTLTNGSTIRGGESIQISGRVVLKLDPNDPRLDVTPVGQVIHVYIGSETDPNKKITANATMINTYWPNGPVITNGTDADGDGIPDDADPTRPLYSNTAGFFEGHFVFPNQADWPNFGITSGSSITIYLRYEENKTLKETGSGIANTGNFTLARVTVTVSSVGTIVEDSNTPFQGIASKMKKIRPGENATGQIKTISTANDPLPNVPLQYRMRNKDTNQVYLPTDINSILKMTVSLPIQTDSSGLAVVNLITTLQSPTGNYSLEIIANFTGYTDNNGVSYFGSNYDGQNESTNFALLQLNFTLTDNTAKDTMDISISVTPQVALLTETSTTTLSNITVTVNVNSYWSSIGTYQIPNLIVNITITNNSPVLQPITFVDAFNIGANISANGKSISAFTDGSGQVRVSINTTFPDFFGPGDAIIGFSVTVINPETSKLSPDYNIPPQQPHIWIEQSRTRSGQASVHPDYNVGTITIQSLPKSTIRPGESINITYLVKDQNNNPLPGIRVYLNSTITDPGVSVVPYGTFTDLNGIIIFNVTTTYGVTTEDPNGIPLSFDVVADFENDSQNFLIGTFHAGTSTFAQYNKTWSKATTSLTIKAIYNYITVNIAVNDTSPRPGDAILVTFTLKNGTTNLAGYDLALTILTGNVNGSVSYTATVITGTFVQGNTYVTSGGKLVIEYDTNYPGTTKSADFNITAIITNTSLKTVFPISDPVLRWNVGQYLNTSGGNTVLTRGSYSNDTVIVSFTPQYRYADVAATFTPNPSPANTTVTVQATVFLKNGGERVPNINVRLIPSTGIPSTNITMITDQGTTDSNGIVTFSFITANQYLLDKGIYNFYIIVDLENDTTTFTTENNGKRISGYFINGTSSNGLYTNNTFQLEVIWIDTVTISITNVNDASNPDAGSNGTHYIAYRQTSDLTVTVNYIQQDGSPLGGVSVTIKLYQADGTYINDLTTVTTNASGLATVSGIFLPSTIRVGTFMLVPVPQGISNVLLSNQTFVVRSGLNISNLQHSIKGSIFTAYFVGNKINITGFVLDDQNQVITNSNYPNSAGNLVGKIKILLVDGNNLATALISKQIAIFNTTNGQFILNNIQIPTTFTGSSIRINVSIETNVDVDLFRPTTVTSNVINVYQDISWNSITISFSNDTNKLISTNNTQITLIGFTNRNFSLIITILDNHGRALDSMTLMITWKSFQLYGTTNGSGTAIFKNENVLTFTGYSNETNTLEIVHILPNSTVLSSNRFLITANFKVFDKAAPTISSINGLTNNSFQSINPTTQLIINATIEDLPVGDSTNTSIQSVTFIFLDASGSQLFTVTPIQSRNTYKVIFDLNNRTLFQQNEEIHFVIVATDNAGNTKQSDPIIFYVDFTAPNAISLEAMNITNDGYAIPDKPLQDGFSINITISDETSTTTQKAITQQKSEGVDVNALILVLKSGNSLQRLSPSQDYTIRIIKRNDASVTIQIILNMTRIITLQESLGLPIESTWELLVNASDLAGNRPASLLSASITFKIDQQAPDLDTLQVIPKPSQYQGEDAYFVNNTQEFLFENVTILDQGTGVLKITLIVNVGNDTQIITFSKIGRQSWQATSSLNFSSIIEPTQLTGEFQFTDYMNNTAKYTIRFIISVQQTTATTPPSSIPPTTSTTPNGGGIGGVLIEFFVSIIMIFGAAVSGIITARFVEIIRNRYFSTPR